MSINLPEQTCGCGYFHFSVNGDYVYPILDTPVGNRINVTKEPLYLEGFKEGSYYNVDWFRMIKTAVQESENDKDFKFACEKFTLDFFTEQEIEGCLACVRANKKEGN